MLFVNPLKKDEPIAKILGILVGDGINDTITLTSTIGNFQVYLALNGKVSLLSGDEYSFNQNNNSVKLNSPAPIGALVLVTTVGKMLFQNLYGFSNLPKPIDRAINDSFLIIANDYKLQNVNISAEQFSSDAPAISFSFSTDNLIYVPSLTINSIQKGEEKIVYCRAILPPNTSVSSYINFAIVVNAQEVPE